MEMDEVYFDGDPEVDSTRRHLERVLEGRPSRRWPWVVATLAGGATAFALWRLKSRRTDAAPTAAHPAAAPTPDLRHAR